MKKIKKEMELEDAPSGFVTLYNYKSPFMPFKDGFGYEGVLLFDGESDKVQCHFCGGWFDYLPGHIKTHGVGASAYKDIVGLRRSTALISESHREKLVANRATSIANLKPGRKKTEEEKEKVRKTAKRNIQIRERQNERGTCPYQLLDRLEKVAQEVGRTPTRKEIDGFDAALTRVYGSVKNAMKLINLKPRKPGQNISTKKVRYTRESLIVLLQNFVKTHDRLPVSSDYRRRIIPSNDTFRRHFGSLKKALKEIK